MIFGIGTDISDVRRFEKWVKEPEFFLRFFNQNEQFEENLQKNTGAACRHYAARFAAKEAFSKALGTGFTGLKLNDFYVAKTKEGKPFFKFGEETLKILKTKAGEKFNVQLSISHEKDYAVAFVIIESLQ